jgi:uncharacterized protein YyaL (SSP411 family)
MPQDEFEVFARRFGIDRAANFEGRWHLHVYRSVQEIAEQLGIDAGEVEARLTRARRSLLEHRQQRVWPGRDEKILTSWNGLAIAGMALAARSLRRPELVESAFRAADFVRRHLWRDSRLLAVSKDGRNRFAAYLDDHAFLLHGLLELLQTRWRSEDLDFATALADTLLEHFQDGASGGFFFTADDHEMLIHRSKSFSDEAVPSGNAIASQALLQLGFLIGEPRYLLAAERTLRAAWQPLEEYPHAHAAMLGALDLQLEPPDIVIIRGPQSDIGSWRDELAKIYAPRRLVFAIPHTAAALPEALAAKQGSTEPVAYVCKGTTCSPPVRSLGALIALTRA